jgi:hypothetical protein
MKLKKIRNALKSLITALHQESQLRKQTPKNNQVPVIVSLTSIPSRLGFVHHAINSLLLQTLTPEKIVLWLHSSLKTKIPSKLVNLQNDIFEIRFTHLDSPHVKLVPALTAFPDNIIVTADDDQMYPNNWLELLYNEHLDHQDKIITNRCNMIAYDDDSNTLPYKDWYRNIPNGTDSLAIMPAGYGGVLYPPNSLHDDTTNSELYLALAPKADDLWFKAMSYLKGTVCRKTSTPSELPTPVLGTRKETLASVNVKQDHNRVQWNAITEHYHFKTPNPPIKYK